MDQKAETRQREIAREEIGSNGCLVWPFILVLLVLMAVVAHSGLRRFEALEHRVRMLELRK